ncbi:MAG: hypothetical protein ACO3CC_16885, partial [Alphaproteobacteria bacterium]
MAPNPAAPPRVELAPGLSIPRLVTGLWQVADLERVAVDEQCMVAYTGHRSELIHDSARHAGCEVLGATTY